MASLTKYINTATVCEKKVFALPRQMWPEKTLVEDSCKAESTYPMKAANKNTVKSSGRYPYGIWQIKS